jgi:hypothetical protein
VISLATPEQAQTIARAAYTTATANGTAPLSAADRRAITGALRTVFGRDDDVDLDALAPIPSIDLVHSLNDEQLCTNVVRVLAVVAFLDGVVEQSKLEYVLDVASALHVHAEFVDALHQLALNHVRWVAHDMIRANVATIPGIPWLPDDPYAAFLPYHDAGLDAVLADRYDELATLEPSTFGRAFYEHYRRNRYEFPGRENAIAEVWATPHDSLHVLSGYSTSAQGELLVAAFTGGVLKHDVDLMESHVVPTILIYHLGIDINKGLNAGDRTRMAADPSWRDNYDGNVHLGLDAEKLWVAWARGGTMTEDVYSGHWSFWDHVETSLEELRDRWRIEPLAPDMAAVGDDEVDRDEFARPGMPAPPPVSTVPIADRPPSGRW